MVNPMNFVILGVSKKGTRDIIHIPWDMSSLFCPIFLKESPPSVVLLLEKPYPTRTLVEK